MMLISSIKDFLNKGNERTLLIKRNVAFSFFLKMINICISLVIVPLTINYIDADRYGIWLTLSSLISWIAFFDIGVTHGFRNKFAEALAKGEITLAKKYVSTTYVTLASIFIPLACILCTLNFFLNWSNILNISESYNSELQWVFFIIILFFCLNLILSVVRLMLTATQRPAISFSFQTIGQLVSLIFIYILTQHSTPSIINLALCFSGIPCLVVIIASFAIFHNKRFKQYTPSLYYIDFSLNRNIIGLGIKFFFISLFMVLIFQFMNVIISRVKGPMEVTNYNIAYKYFNVLLMCSMIVLQPFWSSFTDAYTKKDYSWMLNISRKLEKLALFVIPLVGIMILLSEFIYKIWVKDAVQINLSLTISVAIYVTTTVFANVYMVMINGTGKVGIQMLIYGIAAIISFPLMSLLCKQGGVEAMLLVPTSIYAAQCVSGRIQLHKILNQRAKGLWNR